MATGAAVGVVDNFLAQFLNGTASTIVYGTLYVQLHTGDPGAAGTSLIAGESTREAAGAFATPAGGSTTNATAITWTSVSTAETYTDFSLWTASASGTFVASGTITANAVAVGDNFTIPVGDMTISMPVAS